MNSALLALITTTGTLIAVLLGGWLTSHNQKRERQSRFFREQLGEFYGPMLAMRAEVLAKSELRSRISGAAHAEWQQLIGHARRSGSVEGIGETDFTIFEEIIKFNDRQFAEDIMPIYNKMVQRFINNMHFAEVSTIAYLDELIEFVEIWNRWFAQSLPADIVQRLGHSEEKLFPFYRDVASHFVALQAKVKDVHRWWHRIRGFERIKVVPSQ